MRREFQSMEQVPESRIPGQLASPGSSAQSCYAALRWIYACII